ncbi:ferritin-like protein [Chitinophagaceae bacterium LB-8]|uniref:Ferritin-like protein n=1 Tax=Paraflavisolibacter caeni TaxID=2982496 RepID=A0A9X2XVN9_9BACT|nr:ferritin-like protein [Paraflavisolibacter caeni]MCU7549855.1 ferritin-like protein [Paraflavisolibacter caeni]
MIKISREIFALTETGDIEDLKKALQHAIELEHSTIPPYLYAMYSLSGSGSVANQKIAATIMDIALEEMLHMLLVGNILKAIGSSPQVFSENFVPNYPSSLPGSVGSVVVPLKPFSRQVVKDIFMEIEAPENPLNFEIKEIAFTLEPPKTIGEFYGRIKKVFEEQGDAIITDTTGDTQPTSSFPVNMRITSAQKAIDAINVIVEQGEGTSTTPLFPDGDASPDNDHLAHFYRFAELVYGKIKKNPAPKPGDPPEKQFIYDSADPVSFDEQQVILLPDNPKSAQYAEGSDARALSDEFNRTYTRILKFIHQAFNTNPNRLDNAVNLMPMLSDTVARLMKIDLGNGKKAAPTFEFLP